MTIRQWILSSALHQSLILSGINADAIRVSETVSNEADLAKPPR